MKRVLISCNLAPSGGCETHIAHLAPMLRRAGAEVTLIAQAYQLDEVRRTRLDEAGVRVVTTPFDWNSPHPRLRQLWAAVAARVRLGREYDTLLGVGAGGFHLFCKQFVKRGGLSIYNHVGAPVGLNRMQQWSLQKMDAVIAMSPTVANALRDTYGRGEPLASLPHLTHPGQLHDLPPDGPAGDRELRVGFFGGLVAGKRPDLLVRLWPTLEIGVARLDLHGGGHLFEPLRAEVHRLGRSDVEVHGPYRHDALSTLMHRSDFVVLPSLFEGLPQVLIEAMAHGVPFVATDVGGVRDLAVDNPDVLVVGTGESDVAEGVREMARRVRSGAVSRHRLRELWRRRYSPEVVEAAWRAALLSPERFFDACGRGR